MQDQNQDTVLVNLTSPVLIYPVSLLYRHCFKSSSDFGSETAIFPKHNNFEPSKLLATGLRLPTPLNLTLRFFPVLVSKDICQTTVFLSFLYTHLSDKFEV